MPIARSPARGYRGFVLARLILALLLAAFATPGGAASACHDAPMAAMPAGDAMAAAMHRHERPAVAHSCIGCIPPADWTAARVTPPPVLAAPAAVSTTVTLATGAALPPTTPPPRVD